jgi:hypothetical protein
LRRVVIEVIEQGGELMPTLVEQWLERGWQEGLVKGIERGREAALDVLRRFLAHRFGTPLAQFDEVLKELDLAAITQLSEAAFEAKNLMEFEAALASLQPREGDEITAQNN